MMQRRPMEYGRGQGFEPGRGGRGFNRGDAPTPEGQGRGMDRPNRQERPSPGSRGERGWNERPRSPRGPGGPDKPAELSEEKGKTIEAPTEADKPKEDSPTGEEV